MATKFALGRSAWYLNTAAWDAWTGPSTQSGFMPGTIGVLPPFVAAFQGLVKCLVITLAMLVQRAPKMNQIVPRVIQALEQVAHATIFKRCPRVYPVPVDEGGRTARDDLDSFAGALDELVDQHASMVDGDFPAGGSLVSELASLHRLSVHMQFCAQSAFGSFYVDCPEIVANLKYMTDFMEILSTWSACMANKLEQAEAVQKVSGDTGSSGVEVTVIDAPSSDAGWS